MDLSTPFSASDEVLLARCETWREFVERYANDIGSGGMFIATGLEPEPLSTLEVRLQLPEATEIVFRARVVHVVSAEQARQYRKPPGVGVELLDMDPERKKQIQQLVEFARRQGASNDPNASFARTLLELSPALPAAEIGLRLSLLPGAGARSGDSSSSLKQTGISSNAPRRSNPSSTTLKVTSVSPDTRTRSSDSASTMKRADSVNLAPKRADSVNLAPKRADSVNLAPKRADSVHLAPKRGDSVNLAPGSAESSMAMKAQAAAPGNSKRAGDAQDAGQGRAAAGSSDTNLKAANEAPAAPLRPPKPTDPVKLKLVLTEFAHKHYEAAIRTTREMLESNPGDPQALRWQHMCHARLALMRSDIAGAVEHYDAALSYDDDNREAREYVRNIRRDKKLNSIPFGRYFTKKK